MNRRILLVALMVLGAAVLAGVGSLLLWQAPALAEGAAAGAATAIDPDVLRWGYMAAALATGLSALGAAYAVSVSARRRWGPWPRSRNSSAGS